jgi:hypothetical protein
VWQSRMREIMAGYLAGLFHVGRSAYRNRGAKDTVVDDGVSAFFLRVSAVLDTFIPLAGLVQKAVVASLGIGFPASFWPQV